VWDAERRELRVGAVLVKRFRQQAADQLTILAAFQEEGWPPRIIANLNRAHKVTLIRFGGGGDGQSIMWRWIEE